MEFGWLVMYAQSREVHGKDKKLKRRDVKELCAKLMRLFLCILSCQLDTKKPSHFFRRCTEVEAVTAVEARREDRGHTSGERH